MPDKRFTIMALLLAAMATAGVEAPADVKPADIFGDFMVLQRDVAVPVWGKADPGEKVTVEFAGQTKSAVAGKNGEWMVRLDPMKASAEGRAMSIKGKNAVEFKDVLVGEVWICSGQSNMQFGVNAVKDLKKLVPEAAKRPIRTYDVPCHIAKKPEGRLCGRWSARPPSSAVAFGFAYFLQKKIDVPIGIILTCWGSSSIEGWMPIEMTDTLPHFKKMMEKEAADPNIQKAIDLVIEQFEKHGRVKPQYSDDSEEDKKLKEILGKKCGHYRRDANIFARTRPNLLYNAMLHGAIPYAVRGEVWYQGEANTRSYEAEKRYATSLKTWTKKLRELWKNDDFKMLVVMLPGFRKMLPKSPEKKDLNYPGNVTWAYMRESQMKVSELPGAYVVNTADLGEARNIHPKDKKPVCERLAALAAGKVYGKEGLCLGPVFDGFKVENGGMIVKFKNADGLKTTDGQPPKGFWLTDERHEKWYPAKAEIKGDTVLLSSDKVPEPAACRYAFAAKPEVNLVNADGFPAYPFRTDDWTP